MEYRLQSSRGWRVEINKGNSQYVLLVDVRETVARMDAAVFTAQNASSTSDASTLSDAETVQTCAIAKRERESPYRVFRTWIKTITE